jgi:hypothetical protein
VARTVAGAALNRDCNVPVERIFVLGTRSKLALEDVSRKEL